MTDILRLILPVYFTVFFALAFVLKSLIVAKRIKKNPFVIPTDDGVFALVGFYFKLSLLAMFIYTLVFAFIPDWHNSFGTIFYIDNQPIKYTGLAILVLALIWTLVSQQHMHDSWRIGIDLETKTALVTKGVFAISRNPIFLGMIMSLTGLFLTTPNTFTLLFLIVGYILIQIQIRLEEEFLEKQHGNVYIDYKQKVRRFI